jgi:predicted ATPase/DNA-binding SARP family transcriptional activator
MPDFKFSLFGHPLFERESIRLDFGLRKSTAILAFLSIEKQLYSREELAAIFWPEVGHATALGNLRRALYRINHACGIDLIHADRSSIEINREIDLWLDVDAFQSYIGACLCSSPVYDPLPADCLENLVHADKLYTADFLAGFGLPDCPVFDEWQFFQMDSLRRSYNAVLKCLMQEFRDREELEKAIWYARRRLTLDVLDESAHRDVMELYGLNNQYGAAVRQYEECCRILASELAVQPEEETASLYQAIKQRRVSASQRTPAREIFTNYTFGEHDSGSSPVLKISTIQRISKPGPPHNLPIQPFPFIGRERELVDIQQLLLNSSKRRLVTITGPGGIGKTRLAIEAAASVFREFPHGVFLVSLSELTSPDGIIQAVADKIGLAYSQGSAAPVQLFEFLEDKHLLIILDSYEHLVLDVSFLSSLLQKTERVKVLVTSRERLALSSETVYSLGGMEFPERESLENYQEYSAVQLFIQCARLVRPQFEIRREDMQSIFRICRYVQGMPLAIVLSAGWLQAITLQQIAEEIEQNLDFLAGTMRDLPERQRSVRAVFDYSWKRLNKEDQIAFMRLCIFIGGFSIRSAQRVADVSLMTLRNLIDKSLVFIQQDGRYQIHSLLRQFGAEYLENSGEAEEIHLRHSENYLSSLEERKEDLKGRNQVGALEEIETDFQNIRLAWEYAVEAGRVSAVQGALESMYLFCDLRGRQKVGVELFTFAWEKLKSDNPLYTERLDERLLTHSGMLRSRYERFNPEIGNILKAGLETAVRCEDPDGIAFGNLALGHFFLDNMQDFETALSYFKESHSMFVQTGDDYYLGRAVHMIGVCRAFQGGNYELLEYLQESLLISRRIGDLNSEVMLLVSISMVNFYLGDFEAAISYAQEAAHYAGDVGQSASLAQTDTFLGIIHLARGQLEKAQLYVNIGASIAEEVNFPLPLLFSKAVSSILGGFNGNVDESLETIQECKAFPADPCSNTFILWASALVHTIAGNYDAARNEIRSLVEWDKKYNVPAILRMSLPVVIAILAIENNSYLALEALGVEENHPMNITGWKSAWSGYEEIRAGLAALLAAQDYQAVYEQGSVISLDTLLEKVVVSWGQPEMVTPD